MQAPGSEVGERFGPYELRSLLGSGGMGEVYEAYDTVKERVVALKLLSGDLVGDPEYQTRFRRESQAAARLAEPHIIPIHDWGVIDGRLFIDMRLVAGTDLRTLVESAGPLGPQRAVSVIEQIAAALDAAHADGLVHRDVKPANILVTDADFAYLADFGIAHHAGDSAVTQAGVAVGSYSYMAPERFERVPVTARADIYSLACVLHECLTGTQPFDAPSLGMLIRAHLAEPPPRASLQRTGLPAAFDEVIACGMAKDPLDRFATAGEFAVAARTALNSPARPPQSPAGTGEFPATPVGAESAPATGGIPTLVVRIPNRDEDGAPDQTAILPAIIPGDPTSVRPTEFVFTPLGTEEPADTEGPAAGIRPFPDAHLYQDEQLHPAADPAVRPDAAPATGGMPVADFYPPEQATRIYGRGHVPTAPGPEGTVEPFADPAGAEATRAYRPAAGPDDHAYRSDGYAYGTADPDGHGYGSGDHAYRSNSYGIPEQPSDPYARGYRSAEYPMDAHGAGRPEGYGPLPEDDPRQAEATTHLPAGGAYDPGHAYPLDAPTQRRDTDSGSPGGDWWTAERGEHPDQPPAPVHPGPGGLFGYGGADSVPAAPQPDPYAAAYEAGYRDSYLANTGRPPTPGPAPRRSRTMPILAGAGVFLFVVLIAVIGFGFLDSGGDESPSAAESPGAATTTGARTSAPTTSAAPTGTSTTTTARAELPAGAQPCTSASGGGAYGSAAAGTAVTSCEFAEAVRQAYLNPTVVSAAGEPVSVEATSPVTGQAYTLECVAADGLVTCRGGNNAVVYLY